MLVKRFEKDPNDPTDVELVYWRYWCTCLTPTHCLELVQHGEDIEIGIHTGSELGFWRRLKVAWNILRGHGDRYTEVVIGKEDREELAALIKGDIVA